MKCIGVLGQRYQFSPTNIYFSAYLNSEILIPSIISRAKGSLCSISSIFPATIKAAHPYILSIELGTPDPF